MAILEVINIASYPNEGNGDKIRDAYGKINRNFEKLNTAVSASERFRGAYDLSTEEYPSDGGNGIDGVPDPGDYWYGINSGTFDVEGFETDTIELFRGATLLYIGGDVADPASWIVKQ